MQITIEEVYRQKGEIVTQMEILQARLQMVNQQLQSFLNQPNQPVQVNGNPKTS